VGAPLVGRHVVLSIKFHRDPAEDAPAMGSFLRAFYLLMFSVPAILFLAGVPGSSTREELAAQNEVTQSSLEGRTWRVPKHGIELQLPQDWAWLSTGTRDSVCLDPNRRERASISVISLPNFFGKNLFQLEAENVDALRATPSVTLDASRRLRVGTVDVLRFDYHGKQLGLESEMRYTCFVWLVGAKQVVLTAQLDAAQWPERGQALEEALASLRISGS
jgi:hypothetical protein